MSFITVESIAKLDSENAKLKNEIQKKNNIINQIIKFASTSKNTLLVNLLDDLLHKDGDFFDINKM